MLKDKQPYQGLFEQEYEEKFRQREFNSPQRAARLSYFFFFEPESPADIIVKARARTTPAKARTCQSKTG